jgi:amidase
MPTIFERDTVNAFCREAPIEIYSRASGPLHGLTFGVKDIFDIANVPTGFGSPAWLNSYRIF